MDQLTSHQAELVAKIITARADGQFTDKDLTIFFGGDPEPCSLEDLPRRICEEAAKAFHHFNPTLGRWHIFKGIGRIG